MLLSTSTLACLLVPLLLMTVGLATGSSVMPLRLGNKRPALDARAAIERVLDEIESEGEAAASVFDIGRTLTNKGAAVSALQSDELVRFLDPTLLTLESMLFETYCTTPTISEFNRKCKALNQPFAYSGCNQFGSLRGKGSVDFVASSVPNQQCNFFVESQGNKITVTCVGLDRLADLANVKVSSAANAADSRVLSLAASSVVYTNGVNIRFKNNADGNQKITCTWTSVPIGF